ncbi:MAG: AsmA-like C-terminal domain-containing protein [Alphaproteobacteria bacterium]|nr:AsmA-like C-terminal domain-containing protein [Alphaproteobacteria bacterium]
MVPYLANYSENVLNKFEKNYHFSIRQTYMGWESFSEPIKIDAKYVTFKRIGEDQNIATFPDISLHFKLFHLLTGRWRPSAIVFNSPDVHMFQENFVGPPMPFIMEDIAIGLGKAAKLINSIDLEGAKDITLEAYDARLQIPLKDRFLPLTITKFVGKLDLSQKDPVVLCQASIGSKKHQDEFHMEATLPRNEGISLMVDFDHLSLVSLDHFIPRPTMLQQADFDIDGKIEIQADVNSVIKSATVAITNGKGKIKDPAYFETPMAISNMRGKAEFSKDLNTLNLKEMYLMIGSQLVYVSGKWDGIIADDSTYVINTALQGFPVNDLGNYWPVNVVPHAREWVTHNVKQGHITKAAAQITLKKSYFKEGNKLPDNFFNAALYIDGSQVSFMDNVPPVSHVSGILRFVDNGLDIKVSQGTLGKTELENAEIKIPYFDKDKTDVVIHGKCKGPMTDAQIFIPSSVSENSMVRSLFKKNKLVGQAVSEFNVLIPTTAPDIATATTYQVTSQINGVGASNVFDKLNLSEGKLLMNLDKDGIKIKGNIDVNHLDVDVNMQHFFGKNVPYDARFLFKTNLYPSDVNAFGFTAPSFLSESTPVAIAYTMRGDNVDIDARANLQPTIIDLPSINYHKNAGEAATLEMLATKQGTNPFAINTIKVNLGRIKASGRGIMDPVHNRLKNLIFDEITADKQRGNASLEFYDNGFSVVANASVIDMSKVNIRDLVSKKQSNKRSDYPMLSFSLKTKRLQMKNNVAIQDLEVVSTCDQIRCNSIMAKGAFFGEKPLSIDYRQVDNNAKINIQTDDAGSLLRGLDIYKNLFFGKMDLDMKRQPALATAQGNLTITDFQILRAPILAKILTLSSYTGIADALKGNGVSFKKLTLPFILNGDILTITNAKAAGSALGITMDGTIDTRTDYLAINGNLVPAYAVNSIFGNIPIFGELLVGGKGEGLFAARYTLKGAGDDAKVSVNPLSILTPGFLRGLFDIVQ